MTRRFSFMPHLLRVVLTSLLALVACLSQSVAQARHHSKIFGGYFEEWGINYGGYNIADFQRNGVADELTHLIYAFGNVTPTSPPACAIADPVAAYQNSTVPSVSGKPYAAPLYGNYGATPQTHAPVKAFYVYSGRPRLKLFHFFRSDAGNICP